MLTARTSPDGRFALRLALFYAALFLAFGVQLPFFPLWLRAKGLDAPLIGLVLSIPMVVRVFAIPFASHQADRRDALRATLACAAVATAVAYVVVGLMEGPLAIVLACTAAAVVYAPINSLTDAYAVKGLMAHGRAYGPVRLWGSGAFVVGMLGAGAAIDVMPARHLIWLIAAGAILTAVMTFALAPLPSPASAVQARSALRPLLRDRAFLAMLAAAALIQSSHSLYYGFSTLQWAAAGFDGKVIAALWALGVVAEIVLFALQGRLPQWLTPTTMLLVGAGGAVLRWSVMALDPPELLLPGLQCLHALSFGCTHLGALGFLAQATPHGHAARAQGYLSTALGLASAGAMSLSGVLYAACGVAAYAAMALVAAAGGACALFVRHLGR
jgi:MFS transporter, PPP family, 3-phenylpropionic acid transporter